MGPDLLDFPSRPKFSWISELLLRWMVKDPNKNILMLYTNVHTSMIKYKNQISIWLLRQWKVLCYSRNSMEEVLIFVRKLQKMKFSLKIFLAIANAFHRKDPLSSIFNTFQFFCGYFTLLVLIMSPSKFFNPDLILKFPDLILLVINVNYLSRWFPFSSGNFEIWFKPASIYFRCCFSELRNESRDGKKKTSRVNWILRKITYFSCMR